MLITNINHQRSFSNRLTKGKYYKVDHKLGRSKMEGVEEVSFKGHEINIIFRFGSFLGMGKFNTGYI